MIWQWVIFSVRDRISKSYQVVQNGLIVQSTAKYYYMQEYKWNSDFRITFTPVIYCRSFAPGLVRVRDEFMFTFRTLRDLLHIMGMCQAHIDNEATQLIGIKITLLAEYSQFTE